MKYLLDANVFMTAGNLHYGLDFCPAFWNWLEQQNNAGKVFSIDHVKNEVFAFEDEVSDWEKSVAEQFFLSLPADLVSTLQQIDNWLQSQSYEETAIRTFTKVADYYLVAHALSEEFVVVTHEIPSNSKKKVKIPDVCIGMNVKCMTPFQMLSLERARFVLA